MTFSSDNFEISVTYHSINYGLRNPSMYYLFIYMTYVLHISSLCTMYVPLHYRFDTFLQTYARFDDIIFCVECFSI